MFISGPTLAEPPIDDRFALLYEDEVLAVVDKSGNLPCHAGGRYREHTLARLLETRAGFREIHWVNRLDRETSGTVLVAKTAEAASRLGKALMAGRFQKTYRVLVEGPWRDAPELRATGKIYPVSGREVLKMRLFIPGDSNVRVGDIISEHTVRGPGQEAETRFRFLGERDGIVLLEACPRTGRVHQIRATLKALGYPVVGDKLYGPDETLYARMCDDALMEDDRRRLRVPRQALHAFRLAFPHPYSGTLLEVEAPLPEDIRVFA